MCSPITHISVDKACTFWICFLSTTQRTLCINALVKKRTHFGFHNPIDNTFTNILFIFLLYLYFEIIHIDKHSTFVFRILENLPSVKTVTFILMLVKGNPCRKYFLNYIILHLYVIVVMRIVKSQNKCFGKQMYKWYNNKVILYMLRVVIRSRSNHVTSTLKLNGGTIQVLKCTNCIELNYVEYNLCNAEVVCYELKFNYVFKFYMNNNDIKKYH